MFACCEGILKEKKGSLSRQISVLDFLKASSGTRASPPVLLDVENGGPNDSPTVQVQVPSP
jgi:hypothetical protein